MDKEKVIQELQERTEEIKEKAGELHKAIEETISQKKQMHYTELGGQDGQPDVPVKEGYGLVLGGGGGRGSYEIGVWKALEEYRDRYKGGVRKLGRRTECGIVRLRRSG